MTCAIVDLHSNLTQFWQIIAFLFDPLFLSQPQLGRGIYWLLMDQFSVQNLGQIVVQINTQCSPSYNTMLDHVFVKEGTNLAVQDVEIQQTQSSYCEKDSMGYADHRPVIATFQITP